MLFQNVICRFKQDRSNLFGKQIFAKKCAKIKNLLAYFANLCAEISIFARKNSFVNNFKFSWSNKSA